MTKKRMPVRGSGSPYSSPVPTGFGFSSASASVLSYVAEPPDLSEISDSSTVVLFKNLLKKDEVTKAKALEDLQGRISESQEVEEAVIGAWVRLFPRLSTDISRRVRQLSHLLHGAICQKSGKRIAKQMPKIVGPWLAGLYDNDSGVSRAAVEALKTVFTTEEKVKNIWRLYQPAILEYCKNAVTNETVSSLSDEKSISPDDAEAKYARVMGQCVLIVGRLISELPEDLLVKEENGYRELLSDRLLWSLAHHSDPFLRRALYKLLQITLQEQSDWIAPNLEPIATSLLLKAFTTSQVGSAIAFLDTLIKLAQKFPDVWTRTKSSKGNSVQFNDSEAHGKPTKKKQKSTGSPVSKLLSFLESGSQLSPPDYWNKASQLISIIPKNILPQDLQGVQNWVKAVLVGINSGPEPRTHTIAAWDCYVDVCYLLLGLNEEALDIRTYLLRDALLPIYEVYITGNQEKEQFYIGTYGAIACAHGFTKVKDLGDNSAKTIIDEIPKKLETLVLEAITEQRAASTLGKNWVALSVEVFKQISEQEIVHKVVLESCASVLSACIQSIIESNGKTIVSATILEELLTKAGNTVLKSVTAKAIADIFFRNQLSELLGSPSVDHLLAAFLAYGVFVEERTGFVEAWGKVIRALLLSSLPKEQKETTVAKLLHSVPPLLKGKIPVVSELESYVVNKLRSSLSSDDSIGWEIMKNALHSTGSAISEATSTKLLTELTEGLDTTNEASILKMCRELGSVAGSYPALVSSFIHTESGKALLARLLILTDSPNETISSAAEHTSKQVSKGITAVSSGDKTANVVDSMVDIISKGVREPGTEFLSIEHLVSRAEDLVRSASSDGDKISLAEKLLFSEKEWETALVPFLDSVRSTSLAITNPLGGSIFLIESSSVEAERQQLVWDFQGYSILLRMAIFTTAFFKNPSDGPMGEKVRSGLSAEVKTTMLYNLSIVLELVKDNLSVLGTNSVWKEHGPDEEADILEFISDTQKWIAQADEGVENTVDRLLEASDSFLPRPYYAARALAELMGELCENHPRFREKAESWVQSAAVWKNNDTFRCTAMLASCARMLSPGLLEKIRNELVSSLSGLPSSKASSEGVRKLLYLNATLPKPDEGTLSIPTPRVMMLIKHMLSWFDEENMETELSPALIAESAKTFTGVISLIQDMYGEHWQLLFDFVINCWSGCLELSEEHLPMVFSTLKLFQALKSIVGENDDIEEAWTASKKRIYTTIMDLLVAARQPDEQHQPRNICNVQISRLAKNMSVDDIEDASTLYPLLGVSSFPIQETVYDILHRAIPAGQEQLSIDAALSKDTTIDVRLPPELLSMVIDVPSVPSGLMEASEGIPVSLRGYLLSWVLIFDHFQNASFKVKSAYVEQLKEGHYLVPLLSLIFDSLPRDRHFDPSKFDPVSYTPAVSETSASDAQWLFIHIYYLSLRYTPSLVKSWWLECKNRATVQTVEAFTKNHMSPLLVEMELTSVASWAQTRSADDDENMTVKVSKVAREVTASYPVDDQAMELLVRLPSTFPLKPVEVEGLRRVGLNEQQFKRMQLASQAAVNFWSGSIIDALTLFSKNVKLHFQGITECAICYSILAVTPDRSLPNKACSTCKNKFHSSCLLKWFKSSNSSSCPLCRTSFSFYY